MGKQQEEDTERWKVEQGKIDAEKKENGIKDRGERQKSSAVWESGVELAVCPAVAKVTFVWAVNND